MSATAEFLSDVSNPKRHAIMAAAAELFMAEGYAAVSMDAVAKTSGVSKATLYAHFSGKEALFEAIVAAGCEHMREQAEEFLGGHDRPLREALVELGLHWLRFMLRRQVRALHRVMIAEGVRFPALARAFYAAGPQAMHSWLSGWMAGELARGRLRPEVRPAQAAEHFLSLLRGDLFVRATLGLVGEDAAAAELQGIAEQVADTFLHLHGVAADGFA